MLTVSYTYLMVVSLTETYSVIAIINRHILPDSIVLLHTDETHVCCVTDQKPKNLHTQQNVQLAIQLHGAESFLRSRQLLSYSRTS
jgi:hypothetical protein